MLEAAMAKNTEKLESLARAEEEATRRLAEMEIAQVYSDDLKGK